MTRGGISYFKAQAGWGTGMKPLLQASAHNCLASSAVFTGSEIMITLPAYYACVNASKASCVSLGSWGTVWLYPLRTVHNSFLRTRPCMSVKYRYIGVGILSLLFMYILVFVVDWFYIATHTIHEVCHLLVCIYPNRPVRVQCIYLLLCIYVIEVYSPQPASRYVSAKVFITECR